MSHRYRTDDRDRSRDRSREKRRDRSGDRSRRSPTYDPDNGGDDRNEPSVFAWIPSAGIGYDVISEDLPLYMGANSTVERAKNPKDGRTPGYFVRGPYTLTVPMLSDLKRDTIDWEEERSNTGTRDYRKSKTRNRRRGIGVSRPLATPQQTMTNPPQRTDSMPIPQNRHDRNDDSRASFVDPSPRSTGQFSSNYPPERTSSRQQPPARGGYDEPLDPSRSSDGYSRHETPRSTAQSQGRDSSINPSFPSTTNTQNTGQPRNPTGPTAQSGNQPIYTRADVERRMAQKFKDEGQTAINRDEFDRAVDDAYRRVQQQQASTQTAPPPYSKTPTTQPSTTGTRGFYASTATAGPKPDPGYAQYRY